jgi:hypothetical protein
MEVAIALAYYDSATLTTVKVSLYRRQNKLLALPTRFILCSKGLRGTNTLAYWPNGVSKKEKKFL